LQTDKLLIMGIYLSCSNTLFISNFIHKHYATKTKAIPHAIKRKIIFLISREADKEKQSRLNSEQTHTSKNPFSKTQFKMKKIIAFTLLIVCALTNMTKAESPVKTTESHFRPIKVSFLIASRKQNCEAGIGICKLTIESDIGVRNTGVMVSATPSYSKTQLLLDIQKGDMGSGALATMKTATSFPIEDNFVIPYDVARGFGASGDVTVLMGKYSIKETATSYTIILNCR